MERYRLDPEAGRRIHASVESRSFSAHALSNALGDALQAIRSAGDAGTDLVIFALGGLEADLHDAPARIDARVARASDALAGVLRAIEDGDQRMSAETPTVQSLLGTQSEQNRLRP
jgi:hypothetical protein